LAVKGLRQLIGAKSFENMAKFKYLKRHWQIKIAFSNKEKVHLIQGMLAIFWFQIFPAKNVTIKIYMSIILYLVLRGFDTWSHNKKIYCVNHIKKYGRLVSIPILIDNC
jgi:uncharacterized membrane protein YbaN (DUF454 family)